MSELEQFKRLLGAGIHDAVIGHLSANQELRDISRDIVLFFDAAVDALRSTFPNRHINELVTLMWRLIGNQMILSASGPVPTLSFTALGHSLEDLQAVVLIPPKWPESVANNYYFELGGLVFVASQCRDWYNGRLKVTPNSLGSPEVVRRAYCYEAEYLLTLLGQVPDYQLNKYQRQVLEGAPKGVASMGGLAYESRPFQLGMPSSLLLNAVVNSLAGEDHDGGQREVGQGSSTADNGG